MNEWTNVVSLKAAEATVRVSRAVYCLDVLRPKTIDDAIPLGVFVDLQVSNVIYGLGLMARSSISSNELTRVGGLARPMVSRPFDYLSKEFDRMFSAKNPSREFENLPNMHSTALTMSTSTHKSIQLPRHLRLKSDEYAAFDSWAKDTLEAELRSEFWNLLDEHWPGANFQSESKSDARMAA